MPNMNLAYPIIFSVKYQPWASDTLLLCNVELEPAIRSSSSLLAKKQGLLFSLARVFWLKVCYNWRFYYKTSSCYFVILKIELKERIKQKLKLPLLPLWGHRQGTCTSCGARVIWEQGLHGRQRVVISLLSGTKRPVERKLSQVINHHKKGFFPPSFLAGRRSLGLGFSNLKCHKHPPFACRLPPKRADTACGFTNDTKTKINN